MNEGKKISYTVTPNNPGQTPITIETNKKIEQTIEVLEEVHTKVEEPKVENI